MICKKKLWVGKVVLLSYTDSIGKGFKKNIIKHITSFKDCAYPVESLSQKTTKQSTIMEYQSFKFGGRPHNAYAYRQTITPEEYQRRLEFYKKKYEADKKAREEAVANQEVQENNAPMVELREQPLGTEPEHVPTANVQEASEDNQELDHPSNDDQHEEELLEVDRLYLQRDNQTEDSPAMMSPAFEKLYNAAQGKRPRR
jgi:hypothetical protein